MHSLLLILGVFLVGFAAGFVASYAHNVGQGRQNPPDLAQERMGMLSSPHLSHYFRLRSMEKSDYWKSMPLREYRKKRFSVNPSSLTGRKP